MMSKRMLLRRPRGGVQEVECPAVMGIMNITDDSFYYASRCNTKEDFLDHLPAMLAAGAQIIDVGACSTRPGSTPVSEAEELARLRAALPELRAIAPDVLLSVDTFRPTVARACIEEYGVDIINDVSEGSDEMFSVVGARGATYILMSCQPTIELTKALFSRQLARLEHYGCDQVWLDPGYGFGKDLAQNYALLSRQDELLTFQRPLLVGVSRKRMVWQLLGTTVESALNGTTVLHTLSLLKGASILRVHDVCEAAQTINIVNQCSSALE